MGIQHRPKRRGEPRAGQAERSARPPDPELIRLDPGNAERFGIHCVADPKHPGRQAKVDWFRSEYAHGLRILLLFSHRQGKSLGFVEYAPGESTWRAVDAPGFLVVHCIWVKSAGHGYGSRLIGEVVADAERDGKDGVAVVTSAESWCANSAIFLKNGFEPVAERPPFTLLVRELRAAPRAPRFADIAPPRSPGIEFRHSGQCPYVAKAAFELPEEARAQGVSLELREIRSAAEARASPTPYGITSLVIDGEVVADHAISRTRFRNILRAAGRTR